MIRSRMESIITTTGATQLNIFARDDANATKAQIRLESDTGLVNVQTGNFRVGGTSTLVGAVTTTGTLDVGGNFTSKNATVTNLNSSGGVSTTGSMSCGNGDLRTVADGNSHLWFNTVAGAEKAVIYSGGNKQFNIRANGFNWEFGEGAMIKVNNEAVGSDKALIRGQVQGGGHGEWRDRASGLAIDCPNSGGVAYNIWKATNWSQFHLAAMDVHAANNIVDNTLVRLLVGNQTFLFNGGGEFTSGGNVNANDVYIRSDENLKSNFKKIENALDKVEQLNGLVYDKAQYIGGEPTTVEAGIIAQQLQDVLPEAVRTGQDTKGNEILTVSPTAVIALLVNAVKELREEVRELKAR